MAKLVRREPLLPFVLAIGLCIPTAFSGCVTMKKGNQAPDHGEPEGIVDSTPVIRVVFASDDQHAPPKGVYEALYAAAKSSGVMHSATFQGDTGLPIHYVLFIDARSETSGMGWVVTDALTFAFLLPASYTNTLSVTATLYEAATTEDVAVYKAKGQFIVMWWLPFLPATPFYAAFGPNSREMREDTFRDIFSQLATDLRGKPLPKPVEDSNLQIRRVPQMQMNRAAPKN